MEWNVVATKEQVEKTIIALKSKNIEAEFVATGAEAKKRLFDILPEGAEVMSMTSVTLDTIGVPKEINESGRFNAVRPKLTDKNTSDREKKRLGAAPEWVAGSVQAVSENGTVMVASNTGSQLPAYLYGADHVIWIVGAQKIVKDEESGRRRVYEHVLPLESERAKKAYGVAGSFVSKLAIFNKEVTPGRIRMIIVGEALGF